MVAGTPPWQGARPWPLPAPLGRVCVSSCRGEWDGVRFRGASHHGVVWDVLGCEVVSGSERQGLRGLSHSGAPPFVLGRAHLSAVWEPRAPLVRARRVW